jgi:putative flippase GtrA
MIAAPDVTVKRFPVTTQLARFGVIGFSTVSLDFIVLYLLVRTLHASYFWSALTSYIIASIVNYLLSVRYVFLGGRFGKAQEFTIFMVTTGIGLGLNQLIMWALAGLGGINYMLAKCASLFVVTCWNFLSKKKLVFLD